MVIDKFVSAVKTIRITLLSLVCFITSCVSTHHVGSSKYPPKSVELVATYFQEPTRPYEVVAFVEATSVTIFDSPEKLMGRAREQAAAAGAEAVIFSSTGKWSGMPGVPGTATARAIKWKH